MLDEREGAQRRILTTKRGRHMMVQIRLRQEHESDLFEFATGLRTGAAAGFFRSVLDQAFRSGAVTPSGYALTADDVTRALQIQLRLAVQDKEALREQVRLLKTRLQRFESAGQLVPEPIAPDSIGSAHLPVKPGSSKGVADSTAASVLDSGADTRVDPRVLPMGFAAAMRNGQDD